MPARQRAGLGHFPVDVHGSAGVVARLVRRKTHGLERWHGHLNVSLALLAPTIAKEELMCSKDGRGKREHIQNWVFSPTIWACGRRIAFRLLHSNQAEGT